MPSWRTHATVAKGENAPTDLDFINHSRTRRGYRSQPQRQRGARRYHRTHRVALQPFASIPQRPNRASGDERDEPQPRLLRQQDHERRFHCAIHGWATH